MIPFDDPRIMQALQLTDREMRRGNVRGMQQRSLDMLRERGALRSAEHAAGTGYLARTNPVYNPRGALANLQRVGFNLQGATTHALLEALHEGGSLALQSSRGPLPRKTARVDGYPENMTAMEDAANDLHATATALIVQFDTEPSREVDKLLRQAGFRRNTSLFAIRRLLQPGLYGYITYAQTRERARSNPAPAPEPKSERPTLLKRQIVRQFQKAYASGYDVREAVSAGFALGTGISQNQGYILCGTQGTLTPKGRAKEAAYPPEHQAQADRLYEQLVAFSRSKGETPPPLEELLPPPTAPGMATVARAPIPRPLPPPPAPLPPSTVPTTRIVGSFDLSKLPPELADLVERRIRAATAAGTNKVDFSDLPDEARLLLRGALIRKNPRGWGYRRR